MRGYEYIITMWDMIIHPCLVSLVKLPLELWHEWVMTFYCLTCMPCMRLPIRVQNLMLVYLIAVGKMGPLCYDWSTSVKQLVPNTYISVIVVTGYCCAQRLKPKTIWLAGHQLTTESPLLFDKATIQMTYYPDSKVHGANMGPIWGRQDPGVPHVGPWTLLSG